MKIKEFSKLLKEEKPQKIIYKHIREEIYLTDKQIDRLISKRDKQGRTYG